MKTQNKRLHLQKCQDGNWQNQPITITVPSCYKAPMSNGNTLITEIICWSFPEAPLGRVEGRSKEKREERKQGKDRKKQQRERKRQTLIDRETDK